LQILQAPTESSVLSELTYLASDVNAGSSSITVVNSQGFSDTSGEEDYIVIGRLGDEKTELKQIKTDGISNNTIELNSSLGFAHSKDTQIQKILYNQRRFYRATSKTGQYSLLGTKDIEVDRPDGTFYEDVSGTSSSWYKATYYSTIDNEETSKDDAVATQAAESDHYTSIDSIRKQAGFEEAYGISDESISDFRDLAENEFESAIAGVYSLPLSPKPKLGKQIVELLSAGNLIAKEYGMEADIEISKSGQRMIEKAWSLINKIVDGTLKLVDDDGNVIGTQGSIRFVSGSNVYEQAADKGELFNIGDEPSIVFKDPDLPTS